MNLVLLGSCHHFRFLVAGLLVLVELFLKLLKESGFRPLIAYRRSRLDFELVVQNFGSVGLAPAVE